MPSSPPPEANVVWMDDLDSTAAFAERLMETWLVNEEEQLHDTLLVAGRQSAGRGRGTHAWASPLGGLYANWLAWLPSAELVVLPMAVGVTLASAIERLWPAAKVELKWPNDLLVKGRKLGGILCHSRGAGDLLWVSVGFGINLAADPRLAAGSEARAVSLRALGWSGEPHEGVRTLTVHFLEHVHPALADPDGTRRRWVDRSVHRVGDRLRLRLDEGTVEGRFAGFDLDGRLGLDVNGTLQRYSVGEVLFGPDSGGG